MDLPVGAAVSSLDWSAPVLTEVGLYTIEVLKGDPSPALLRPQANLDMSQSFLSDLDSSKQSSQRVSCNLKNIFPVSTTDHLSSTTLGVSEQIKRQKYLSSHCLRRFPFLHSSLVVCTLSQMIKHFRCIENTKSWNTCTVANQVGTVINQIWYLEGASRHFPFWKEKLKWFPVYGD